MNRSIVVVGFIIVGGGVIKAWTSSPPAAITPVILGGYILVLLLSIMDAFGGELSTLASAIALLAATYIVLTEYLPLFQTLGTVVNTIRTKQGATTPGQGQQPAPITPAPGATYPPYQH